MEPFRDLVICEHVPEVVECQRAHLHLVARVEVYISRLKVEVVYPVLRSRAHLYPVSHFVAVKFHEHAHQGQVVWRNCVVLLLPVCVAETLVTRWREKLVEAIHQHHCVVLVGIV